MAANGLISAVPYIVQALVTFFTGWITDVIRAKGLLRTITLRKINTTLGNLVSRCSHAGWTRAAIFIK